MSEIVRWIGHEILPHEADVRAWLKRSSLPHTDPDDVIQEAYARISRTEAPERIDSPRAYFFTVARNVVLEQMRRARSSPLAPVEDFDALIIVDNEPDPERVVAGRDALRRVVDIMDSLPPKVRQVLLLRRVEGLSQKAVAQQLGVPESTVEKRAAKGLRMLAHAVAGQDAEIIPLSGRRRPSGRDGR